MLRHDIARILCGFNYNGPGKENKTLKGSDLALNSLASRPFRHGIQPKGKHREVLMFKEGFRIYVGLLQQL